ncbi:MAG: prohibitin family protein [Patescibacteria group bacterium]
MEVVNSKNKRKLGGLFGLVLIIFIIAVFSSSFWTVVEAGETGVKSLFGKVKDDELSSGFHLKNPLVRVIKMNIRTQDYTMSIAPGEGNRAESDIISALTKEGLNVDLDLTVLYHLIEEKASDVYRDIGLGYDEIVIRPQIRSIIREVIAQYEAKDIYSEKRQEAAKQIFDILQGKLNPRGIELEDVLLRHVQLPAKLAESISLKLQAEQDTERKSFEIDKERKEAERKVIEATGQRDAQTIINQSLTERYLNYLYINSLKDREGTIYVPTNPNTGVPLFRGL